MTTSTPRYRQLADYLKRQIISKKLAPGSALPTEMDLCATHLVSRHTAREALRILTEDGLIERRRGAGTVVAARVAPSFSHEIGDFDSILQYARDAHLTITASGPADAAELERLGLTGAYEHYIGMRRVRNEPPQALTSVFIASRYAPTADVISGLNGAISEWLERHHNVAISRVVQRMAATNLSAEDAAILGVDRGTAAMRTTRRYRNGREQIILLSESLHPAGRFAYEMRLDRKRV